MVNNIPPVGNITIFRSKEIKDYK